MLRALGEGPQGQRYVQRQVGVAEIDVADNLRRIEVPEPIGGDFVF